MQERDDWKSRARALPECFARNVKAEALAASEPIDPDAPGTDVRVCALCRHAQRCGRWRLTLAVEGVAFQLRDATRTLKALVEGHKNV